ncbi:MAG TPA: M20/M25/M40 family metallo-hydrolase, partial [Candidatus Polarisedimenticolia bacterium]|nr:M20/M25/M40 family metallo-hydrolase [Candidatus Polarisedimenticolia bacterium]
MRRPGFATCAFAAALALATTLAPGPATAKASAAKEAAGLSKAERRVVAAIETREPAARTLLESAVNINSGSNNLDGVRATGALFRKEFEALGFTTDWIDGAAWGRAGHLVARRPAAAGAPRVLLIGHLDTVFPKDSPFQKFAPIPGGSEAHGPGLLDMKGGDVVMLLALGGLLDAGLLDRVEVTAVLIGDE